MRVLEFLMINLTIYLKRFKQVDGSINRKYGGTGLGLAICKELTTILFDKISVKVN